jgi:hypothetical protein
MSPASNCTVNGTVRSMHPRRRCRLTQAATKAPRSEPAARRAGANPETTLWVVEGQGAKRRSKVPDERSEEGSGTTEAKRVWVLIDVGSADSPKRSEGTVELMPFLFLSVFRCVSSGNRFVFLDLSGQTRV